MYIPSRLSRFRIVFSLFAVIFFCLILRLLFIHFSRGEYLNNLAQRQHSFFTELKPRRGRIFDRNLRLQALSLASASLYAVPSKIEKKKSLAKRLSRVLGRDSDYFLRRLRRKKSFIWLARKISDRDAENIKGWGVSGLGFVRENKRRYPNNELAGHILGFSGMDDRGLEGLELRYDSYLRGEPGWYRSIKDARRRPLLIDERLVPARDGYDLVLTVDEIIQFIAEEELDKAYRKSQARVAMLIIVNPNNGEVLALANRPTFDLNKAGRVDGSARRNRAVTDYFEPGSVFKVVTAAAALEENAFSEDDRFFCENGRYRVGGHILHDYKPHGWLTFREVISESSNIGVVKIAQKLGPGVIYDYARRFGFGALSGIDSYGETRGVLRPPAKWSGTSISAVPIGQEVCVTALQLAGMISAVANGGLLYRPHLVRMIQDKRGEIIREFKPQVARRVISQDTARRMRGILADVVNDGT
ncbi:MAG: peptidoglycan D,D-transpeptidase FtsI family protein, partial [Candidatus Omnitrophota bacterium]